MHIFKKLFILSFLLLNTLENNCGAPKKLKVESGFKLIDTVLLDLRNKTSQSKTLIVQCNATEADLRNDIAQTFNIKQNCLNMQLTKPFNVEKISFLFLTIN